MEVALALKILDLAELAVSMWDDAVQGDADLFEMRELMKDMSREEKIALLRQRSESLQAQADELRER